MSDLEKERLRKIKHLILAHKGKENPIHAREISKVVGIPDNATTGGTRRLITKLMIEEDLPIGSFHDGFFLIRNDKELLEYTDYLEQRQRKIANRSVLVNLNYRRLYKSASKINPEDFDDRGV